MQSAIDSKNSSLFLFDSVAAISAAIGVAIPFFDLLVAGATILVNAVAAGTTSHYTDAIASTTLWSEVQCIIYNDIKAVGYVDSSSYTTIGTDLAAISYVHSDVVTAIAAYWVGLGLTAVQSAQAAGSLYVGDCTACGGYSPYCALLNGSDAYISAPIGSSPGNVFTIGGWFYVSSLVTGGAYICDDAGFPPELQIGGGGHPWQYSDTPVGAGPATTGSWTHVVAVQNGTAQTVYIGGSSAATGTTSRSLGTGVLIGKRQDNTFAHGKAYDVRVYAVALSGTDVASWASTGTTSHDSSTADYRLSLPLGAGSGTFAQDISGNGHDGTLHGTAPLWTTK
jgi:hypothetical protein